MSSPKVIVFGPTGNIASIASKTAQEHGAKVFLAMRDPSKQIPGLTPEEEKAGGFERLQADLTQPETVSTAVKQSGATRAFIYMARQSPDHMKGTIEAMKAAGITYVVFLSSFTVTDPASKVPMEELIGFVHAQVEVNLENIYGRGNYCSIRPGGFATNSLQWKSGINSGILKMHGGGFKQDSITPQDMGRVSGTILAKGTDAHAVYLYGPEDIPTKDIAMRIAKALGKGDLKVETQNDDEAREEMAAHGFPMPFVEYMLRMRSGDNASGLEKPFYQQGVENVRKYTGRPAMTIEEWVEESKHLFA